jgi:hypothetical protein
MYRSATDIWAACLVPSMRRSPASARRPRGGWRHWRCSTLSTTRPMSTSPCATSQLTRLTSGSPLSAARRRCWRTCRPRRGSLARGTCCCSTTGCRASTRSSCSRAFATSGAWMCRWCWSRARATRKWQRRRCDWGPPTTSSSTRTTSSRSPQPWRTPTIARGWGASRQRCARASAGTGCSLRARATLSSSSRRRIGVIPRLMQLRSACSAHATKPSCCRLRLRALRPRDSPTGASPLRSLDR